MHRIPCRPRTLLRAALLTLALGGIVSGARAQNQNAVPGTTGSALIVPINGTIRLQTSSKKEIKEVRNTKETVLNIRTVAGDPTTVLVTGQIPDVTEVVLTDVDGKKEIFQVIVQLDLEYLRTQLRRAVPSANINPIPTSNNTVILAGTIDRAEDGLIIEKVAQSIGVQVINALRVGGVQQVQIDVIVAGVTRSEQRNFGFDFLTDSHNFFFGSTVAQAVTQPASTGSAAAGAIFGTAPTLIGSPSADSNVLFGVIHGGWGFLGYLEALRQEGLAKVLVEPKLVVKSGRTASFLVGGEQAVPVPAGLGQVGVQFEEFGTRLNVLPIVLGTGRILLEIEPEVSNLNAANGTTISGVTVPGRDTSRVNTTIELESGQTFAIGGLIQHRVSTNTRKTPVVGDLPFFGAFFSAKSDQDTDQELVILVTPHLVDPQSCDQVTKILPGQETRSPDDFELFLEGILEAPRGPRQVFKDGHYVAAHMTGPTAAMFPCAGGVYGAAGSAPGLGCAACGSAPILAGRGPVPPAATPAAAAAPQAAPPAAPQPTPVATPVVEPAVDPKPGLDAKPTTLPPTLNPGSAPVAPGDRN